MKDDYTSLKQYLYNLPIQKHVADEVAGFFYPVSYSKDEYFAKQGFVSGKIGFVFQGIFGMCYVNENGGQFVKTFIPAGGLCVAAYGAQKESSVSIVALKDSILLEAPYEKIEELYVKYPELGTAARKGIEKRHEKMHTRLEQMTLLEARERYLLFREEFAALEDCIPQYLIASYLGITPTQLSRIRKKMGLINIGK